MIQDIQLISGKYFLLEKDNRFPLVLPTGEWQNLSSQNFNSPVGHSIYLLSGNNNLYVGGDNDGSRPREHKSSLKCHIHANYYMQNVVNKYGLETFYYQPLIEIPKEYVEFRDEIENSYIKLFDTYHNGYNLCEFAKTPMLGRKHSNESKLKMSKSKIGKTIKGHPQTEESKRKRKDTMIRNGTWGVSWNKGKTNIYSKESLLKMSLAKKGKYIGIKHHQSRKVMCIETNRIYDSISEASKDINIHSISICRVCQNKQKTCGGFHWKYI